MKNLLRHLFVYSLAGFACSAFGAISISSSSPYTQSFDTLANTGTSVTWANDSTLAGWYLFRSPAAAPVAIVAYDSGTGSANSGKFYSFGSSGNTERALGGVGSGGAYFGSPTSGNVAGWIAVAFSNDTGSAIDSFKIQYDGEQWRDGGAATPTAQTMVLEYGIGTSFDTVTWTAAGSSFNFTSPVYANTSTGAAVDGNSAGLVAGIGGTVSSLTWNSGQTLWIRWIENNDPGNDHGLAIDNVLFQVPEPSACVLGGLGILVCRLFRRRS